MERLVAGRIVVIEDLRGTTIPVEAQGNPREVFVAVVEEPLKRSRDGRELTVLRRFPGQGKPIQVNFYTFVKGGSENGVSVPGILEEIDLRYNPRIR